MCNLAGFTCRLMQLVDAVYKDARRVHSGLDKHPASSRGRGVADTFDAVKLARAHKIESRFGGGGYNIEGQGTIEGILMINLMPMMGIHVNLAALVARP